MGNTCTSVWKCWEVYGSTNCDREPEPGGGPWQEMTTVFEGSSLGLLWQLTATVSVSPVSRCGCSSAAGAASEGPSQHGHTYSTNGLRRDTRVRKRVELEKCYPSFINVPFFVVPPKKKKLTIDMMSSPEPKWVPAKAFFMCGKRWRWSLRGPTIMVSSQQVHNHCMFA